MRREIRGRGSDWEGENYPNPERFARVHSLEILKERLLGGETDNEIMPSVSKDGTPRIRGWVEPSEDTFSLLDQKAAFVGVAYPEDEIIMEISSEDKLNPITRIIEYNAKTQELTAYREGGGKDPKFIPKDDIDSSLAHKHYMQVLNYFSNKLTTSLAHPYEKKYTEELGKLDDEKESGNHYFIRPNPYEFEMSELQ